MQAVQLDNYGGTDVLELRELPRPVPGPGEVLVRVRAAAINPGEISIREGLLADRWPTTFPSGEGSDVAGLVDELGEGVAGFVIGDAVCGWSDTRNTHAELALVPAEHLVAKPERVSFEAAGSLFVAPFAAYASVHAVRPHAGETVVVSAAAGGVGSIAVQLARRTGATVIGLAGEANHGWLRAHDIIPVSYGDGQAARIREAADGKAIDALMDTHGGGYVDLAIELGVAPDRINTIIDFGAVERLGVKSEGSSQIASRAVLAELAGLVADGSLEIPIAATYPLAQVREAYTRLADRHTRGKIVLLP